jgi:heterodisulfide reductase subunit B
MRYLYYPGCSLKASGRPYEESILAVFERLGLAVTELPGWNCCGGTTYMSADEGKAFVLAARNLCLAEARNGEDTHLIAPCSACFRFHLKTQEYLHAYPAIGKVIVDALASEGLRLKGRVRVRHPLDVLRHDVGLERIRTAVAKPLGGLKVASYYGCLVVRPTTSFDDGFNPVAMDELMQAAGAEPVDWPLKTRCCGGTLTGTVEEAGLRMSQTLLREAGRRGAEVVVTCCPLCQFNLEVYQERMERRFGEKVARPVVYFSQLLGRALGIPDRRLGLRRMVVPLPAARPLPEEVPA